MKRLFLISSAPSQVGQTLHHSEGTSGEQVNYNNAISESNETNNPSSGVFLTVTSPALPDLDAQNAGDSFPPSLSASSVVAGGSVTLTYRLSNFGTGSAPSSTTGIYRSTDGTISTGDTRIGTASDASLSANTGRTETFTIDTTGWAPGTYYIGAVADYNNAISESNETNNPSSGVLLTVTEQPGEPTAWTKPIALQQMPLSVQTSVNQGYNTSPSHTNNLRHSIDFRVSTGNDVLSVVDGEIIAVGGNNDHPYGRYMTIRGDNGLYVSYFHLESYVISSGRVDAGDIVALSGQSGLSSSGLRYPPHLHIQFGTIPSNGVAVPSAATDGVPAAFFASFFSGANRNETAGLIDVLISTQIRCHIPEGDMAVF